MFFRNELKPRLRKGTPMRDSILLSATLLAGCIPTSNMDSNGGKASSRLSSVQMSMPAADALATKDGQKPVTGLRLSIKPVDPAACPSGTSISQVISTLGATTVQQKVMKGCDYDLKIELGKFETAQSGFNLQTLGAVYYAPSSPTRITADQTRDDRISVRVSLALTEEGRRIGLPESLPVPSPVPQQQPQQPATPPPAQPPVAPPPVTPAPTPTPGTQLPALPAKLNVSLTGPGGNVALPTIFTTRYLVVDYSRPGCGPCVSLAKSLENNASFQQMMKGSKCRALTVIPKNQLEDWNASVGGRHTAETSYEYTHSQFAALFNSSVSATPTVMIVDRTGAVVDKKVGGLPDKLQSLCGGN